MRLNTSRQIQRVNTHEGGRSSAISPEQRLLRLTCCCLLWEDSFYVDGKTLAEQIEDVAVQVSVKTLTTQAINLKERNNLRHIPLFIAVLLTEKHKGHKAARLIKRIVTRPDEMGELLSIYWRNGRKPIASQVKKGLRRVFRTFSRYQMSKWNRDSDIMTRDVMFLSHPRPSLGDQEVMFKQIADQTLSSANTWENRLSKGESKKKAFSELMEQGKLGFQACLMNLRNMLEGGISKQDAGTYLIEKSKNTKCLPFQFVSAFKAVPTMIDYIEKAYFEAFRPWFKLKGRTIVMVDVSASMDYNTSKNGTMTLTEVAGALAMFARECCEDIEFFTFSHYLVPVPAYRGFGLMEAIRTSQDHGGTYLAQALTSLYATSPRADRIIIITDEQTADTPRFRKDEQVYIVNVANYKHGVQYGNCVHINGFSPNTLEYIHQLENLQDAQ